MSEIVSSRLLELDRQIKELATHADQTIEQYEVALRQLDPNRIEQIRVNLKISPFDSPDYGNYTYTLYYKDRHFYVNRNYTGTGLNNDTLAFESPPVVRVHVARALPEFMTYLERSADKQLDRLRLLVGDVH